MFKFIKRNYEKATVKLSNKLILTQNKVNKKKLLVEHLKQCILKMVVPKWILFRINSSKLKLSSKTEKLFLQSEILKVEKNIKYLESVAECCSNDLKKKMDSEHFEKFKNYIDETVKKQETKIVKNNIKRLNRLISMKFGTLAKCSVFNLSNRTLTEQEKFALSLGLNFSLPASHVDKETVFFGI